MTKHKTAKLPLHVTRKRITYVLALGSYSRSSAFHSSSTATPQQGLLFSLNGADKTSPEMRQRPFPEENEGLGEMACRSRGGEPKAGVRTELSQV